MGAFIIVLQNNSKQTNKTLKYSFICLNQSQFALN